MRFLYFGVGAFMATVVTADAVSAAVDPEPEGQPQIAPRLKHFPMQFGWDHDGYSEPLYAHSLSPPFLYNHFENEYWDFGGSTLVKVYDYIRLTAERKSQRGYLWSTSQLQFEHWSIDIDFRISGHAPSLFGDGFAFFYVTEKYQEGPVFGFKDQFTGLGVFFDTFANGQHDHSFPYISAMIGDGKTQYDHNNDNKATVAGHGCEANIRGSKEPIRARITYFKNDVLELKFTDNTDKGWQTCFVLSNVTLPQSGYLGFSSATGDLYDNHDIYRVMTFNKLQRDEFSGNNAIDSHLHDDRAAKTAGGSIGSSFWTWFLRLGGLSIVAAVAFYIYRAMNTKSRKVF